MKREDIEKAAIKVIGNRYVIRDVTLSGQELFQFGKDCFADGAELYIKSVWHDASEQPRRNTWYIAQIGDSAFDTFTDSANWKSYAKGLNIICWAYLDDILPNRWQIKHKNRMEIFIE